MNEHLSMVCGINEPKGFRLFWEGSKEGFGKDMETDNDKLVSLLAWAKRSCSKEIYKAMNVEQLRTKDDFWAAYKRAKASIVFKNVKPFNFGRLRCNSSVKR